MVLVRPPKSFFIQRVKCKRDDHAPKNRLQKGRKDEQYMKENVYKKNNEEDGNKLFSLHSGIIS